MFLTISFKILDSKFSDQNIHAVDKFIKMKSNVHYYFAAFLLIIWVSGYLIFNLGGVFHLVFLASVILFLIKILYDFNNLD